jgi:hypothetical protein
MTFENNFTNHSKEYIFADNQTLLNQREKIFNKIIEKKYDKKNNESLKNITILDLDKFDYLYKPKNEDPTVSLIDNFKYEIRLVNGICKNYVDDDIEIRNFTSADSNSFLNQNNNDSDDIIIDLNKIFLNSGVFLNIKSATKLNLRFIHEISDNFTIFQNNFLNFNKNCEVEMDDHFNLSHNSINNINYNNQVGKGAKIKHNIFQNITNSNKLYLTSNTLCEKTHPIVKTRIIFLMVL